MIAFQISVRFSIHRFGFFPGFLAFLKFLRGSLELLNIVDIYPVNQPEVCRIVSFRFSELVIPYTC